MEAHNSIQRTHQESSLKATSTKSKLKRQNMRKSQQSCMIMGLQKRSDEDSSHDGESDNEDYNRSGTPYNPDSLTQLVRRVHRLRPRRGRG
jgi:hypothetical protein